MTKEELKKLVDHEAQWLKYYALADSRAELHFNDILFYDRLRSIGYTKRVTPLDRRCMACVITSDKDVLTDDISKLKAVGEPRDHTKNCYSPLETWIARYPEETQWILAIISEV